MRSHPFERIVIMSMFDTPATTSGQISSTDRYRIKQVKKGNKICSGQNVKRFEQGNATLSARYPATVSQQQAPIGRARRWTPSLEVHQPRNYDTFQLGFTMPSWSPTIVSSNDVNHEWSSQTESTEATTDANTEAATTEAATDFPGADYWGTAEAATAESAADFPGADYWATAEDVDCTESAMWFDSGFEARAWPQEAEAREWPSQAEEEHYYNDDEEADFWFGADYEATAYPQRAEEEYNPIDDELLPGDESKPPVDLDTLQPSREAHDIERHKLLLLKVVQAAGEFTFGNEKALGLPVPSIDVELDNCSDLRIGDTIIFLKQRALGNEGETIMTILCDDREVAPTWTVQKLRPHRVAIAMTTYSRSVTLHRSSAPVASLAERGMDYLKFSITNIFVPKLSISARGPEGKVSADVPILQPGITVIHQLSGLMVDTEYIVKVDGSDAEGCFVEGSELNVRTKALPDPPKLYIKTRTFHSITVIATSIQALKLILHIKGPGLYTSFVWDLPAGQTQLQYTFENLKEASQYSIRADVEVLGTCISGEWHEAETVEYTIWDQPDNEILGVSVEATTQEIRKAFLLKSRESHPDKSSSESTEIFKRLSEAYQKMIKAAALRKADDSEARSPVAANSPTVATCATPTFAGASSPKGKGKGKGKTPEPNQHITVESQILEVRATSCYLSLSNLPPASTMHITLHPAFTQHSASAEQHSMAWADQAGVVLLQFHYLEPDTLYYVDACIFGYNAYIPRISVRTLKANAPVPPPPPPEAAPSQFPSRRASSVPRRRTWNPWNCNGKFQASKFPQRDRSAAPAGRRSPYDGMEAKTRGVFKKFDNNNVRRNRQAVANVEKEHLPLTHEFLVTRHFKVDVIDYTLRDSFVDFKVVATAGVSFALERQQKNEDWNVVGTPDIASGEEMICSCPLELGQNVFRAVAYTTSMELQLVA